MILQLTIVQYILILKTVHKTIKQPVGKPKADFDFRTFFKGVRWGCS